LSSFTITYPPKSVDLLELPELLRPAIEKHRAEAEELGRVPEALLHELREAGAFRLSTPRELGGFEAAPATVLDFYTRVARIDGPTAWLLWNFNLGFSAAWLSGQAVSVVWGSGPDPLVANSGQPGRLRAVEGGYRLTGSWKIVSGSHAAEWFMLAGLLPADAEGAPPELRFCTVPRDAVKVLDTWDVAGMRASDSNSVVAEDVLVPAEMTMNLFDAPRLDRPSYRLPLVHLVFPGCAAVLIGMAQAAVDEVIALAPGKTGVDGLQLAAKDAVQVAVGRALSQVAAARGLLLETARVLDRASAAGRATTDEERAALRGAIAHITETGRAVLVAMYEAGSSDPLYRRSRLGLIFRDGMAAAQAANLSTAQWTIPGRIALGQPVGWPFV
jgi:alkylation response protein AidB-like acyl-CoA dehydrogenase